MQRKHIAPLLLPPLCNTHATEDKTLPMTAPPIFISYRIADTQVEARLLFTDLANHFGRVAVFLDKKRLEGGDNWDDELDRNVRGAKILLVLIKDEAKWLGVKRLGGRRMDDAGDWVRLEIEKSLADLNKKIIPVLVDNAMIPPKDDLPKTLHDLPRKQGEKIICEKWDAGLAELVKTLEKHIGKPAPGAATERIDPLADLPLPADIPDPREHHEAPYLGLPFFSRTAARLFFGRTREILEFFKLVRDPDVQLVSLFGHSGVGKSSLLAAGVLPRLEAAHSPFYERRRITEHPNGIASQLDRLRREPKTAGKPPVYILDQVEEIFTDPLPGEPQAFVESLRRAVKEEPTATIVLGFRSDFQMDVAGLLERVDCHQADLPIYPLSQNALAEAIEGVAKDPKLAKRYHLELENGFAEYVARKLVSDESSSSAAAILQNRLLKLYNAARLPNSPARRLTKEAYDELAQNKKSEAELLDFQLQRLRAEHGVAADDRALLETLDQFVVDKPTAGTLPKSKLPDDPQQLRAAMRRVNLLTELPESQAVRLSHDLLAPVIRQRYQEVLKDENDRLEIENIRLQLREAQRVLENVEFGAAFEEFERASLYRILLPEEVGPMAFELAFVFLNAERREQGETALLHYYNQISTTDKILPARFPERANCRQLLDLLRRCDPALFKEMERRYFPTMRPIPGGTFKMGDVLGDNEHSSEKPVHSVTLSDYELAETPLTWQQFGIFCLETGFKMPHDEGWGRANRPLINVSWDDATKFCQWLFQKTGKNYRLPTEAEWEFAARAVPAPAGGGQGGGLVRFGNGKMMANPSEMNFDASEEHKKDYSEVGEYRGKTTPVDQFPANALGLRDMSGNVWEWCADWYGTYPTEAQTNPTGLKSGASRVLRGGSWLSSPRDCRVAFRLYGTPVVRFYNFGFRLARTN